MRRSFVVSVLVAYVDRMSAFEPSKRQSAILDMVVRNGFVSTDAMVSAFGVTSQTIRRDLNILGRAGLLTRFHGGAGQASSFQNDPYAERQQHQASAKRQIAELTASLVPDNASLFLNIGTTTEAVAQALLGHTGLRVVTNNINVAQILSRNESFEILLAGGQVRNSDGGVTGSSALDFVRGFRMDIGIVGISGIDTTGALLDFDREEVRTARSILDGSQMKILVADQHKFGRHAMHRVGTLSDLDILVTDAAPPPPLISLCEHAGLDVRVAGGKKPDTL